MSKFDKLFNKASANANTGSFVIKSNSFIIKDTEAKAKINFDYKEEAFPDLLACNNNVLVSDTKTKKYSDIAATVNEIKKIQEDPIPPGWTQFTIVKGNRMFTIEHGAKTKRQLEQDQEEEILNDPFYIHNKMIKALSKNWLRYKTQYDSIHGEGAYDLIYYSKPIYPEDENSNSNDYSYDNGNSNKYSYDAEAEAE